MKAQQPSLEKARLEALRAYKILDTPPEMTYDDITLLATFICDVPIALISFIDTDRQWFKSKVGLEITETARDIAFCTHTILSESMMVVKDACRDERFSNNPLVTCAPHIRFYAGVPLLTPTDHYPVGTLCIIDRQPKDLPELQRKALEALARQVMIQLELRRVSHQLAGALEKLEIMSGLVPICSYCKGIRNDEGFWSTVESYVKQHSDVEFTHGVCDGCMREHFPEVAEILQNESPI